MALQREEIIIVGLGNRGRDSFAKAFLAFPNRGLPVFRERARIVAFVDSNVERARVANEALGTSYPVFATLQEAVARHPANWAVITTPDYTHAQTATVALDGGLNIIVDKPGRGGPRCTFLNEVNAQQLMWSALSCSVTFDRDTFLATAGA